ncbi:TPA: alanine--tRNA ligase [Candidatus Uhrbacteria bacterium]|nr:alanine--tRNA ligase [Candidatus Uhrbacteria bacterium]
MTANQLRQKYLDFFKSKGHAEIQSASVVPVNDPTVLFTTAGMHPLVPYLLGEPHPAGKRLVDFQRCIRTGDIDDVGDNTHLTFFTMLGNWSLADYFKQESISWSYEFLTSAEWLNIPLSHLSFTVFEGDANAPFDQEAYDKWLGLGIAPERIAKLGKEDNWWGPAGKTGPCGPDTEIFYWTSAEEPPAVYDPTDKRWMEIWNNVFMQFNKQEDGTLLPFAKGSVDTGMGLERTIVALQHRSNVYQTELFVDILKKLEELSSKAYAADAETMKSMRIIADHIRAASIMVMDGVLPANKDQGYILRRLVRRAIRHGRKLNIESSKMIAAVIDEVVSSLGESYPMLVEKKAAIATAIDDEAKKFEKTLAQGLREFQKVWDKTKSISGEDAFNLYQSFGFPLEVTQELAAEQGQQVDREVFAGEFKKHQDLSRSGAEQKFAGGLADHSVETTRLHTATHLLQQALRDVLGDHVGQKGSNITAERMRFDFSHGEKMTPEQIAQVEAIVNEQIKKDMPVKFELLSVEEAKARGAIGLFEDKYASVGGKIKVYFVGDYSKEICGGPHVEHTGELGGFKIVKEEAVSAGVRRIKAVLGA